jgi:hypothetical protein
MAGERQPEVCAAGIGELIAICLERHHGLSRQEGRRRCLFMDSKGLVCASRTDLQHHKASAPARCLRCAGKAAEAAFGHAPGHKG